MTIFNIKTCIKWFYSKLIIAIHKIHSTNIKYFHIVRYKIRKNSIFLLYICTLKNIICIISNIKIFKNLINFKEVYGIYIYTNVLKL